MDFKFFTDNLEKLNLVNEDKKKFWNDFHYSIQEALEGHLEWKVVREKLENIKKLINKNEGV